MVNFTDANIQELHEAGIPIKTVFGDVYIHSLITGAHEGEIVGANVYHESIHETFLAGNEDILDQSHD